MDFQSLGQGSPFYILRKVQGERPVLETGTVKGKTNPMPHYQTQAVPGAFNGMNFPYVTTVTVTVNGNDRSIPDLPVNVEIAARGNETYTGSKEAIMQAIDAMVQGARQNIANRSYDEMCIEEGERMIETLNPNYAEEKRRAQSIRDLQSRSDEQDKKLAALEQQSSEMLRLLRQMNGTSSSKSSKS